MWHEAIFLFPCFYILIMIVKWTCGTTNENVANKTYESHATESSSYQRLTPRGSLFSVRNTFFFNFLYSAFDYQAATRESTRKKFERHLAMTWRCSLELFTDHWNSLILSPLFSTSFVRFRDTSNVNSALPLVFSPSSFNRYRSIKASYQAPLFQMPLNRLLRDINHRKLSDYWFTSCSFCFN